LGATLRSIGLLPATGAAAAATFGALPDLWGRSRRCFDLGAGGGRGGGGGVPLLLGDDGDEEGQSLDEAPNLRLDLGDQPPWHEPAGLCRDGPDQGDHGMAEALRRGKDWGVVHALFLARMAKGGQGKNDMFR